MCKTIKFNKICIICGVKFTTNNKNELYCCEGCRIIGEKEKSEKLSTSKSVVNKLTKHRCESCGKLFMSMKSEQKLCNDCL